MMRRYTKSIIRILLVSAVVTTCALLFLYYDAEEDKFYFNPFFNGTHMLLPDEFKDKVLPFHQIYEARHVSLEGYHRTVYHQPSTDKLILLWTPWNHQWKTINYYSLQPDHVSFTKYNCPNTKCRVITDRSKIRQADVVIFHLLDTKMDDLPLYRHPNQIWILYNLESPWLINANFKKMDGLFNWTMSYREDSDIVVKYGMLVRRNSSLLDNEFNLTEKKPVVWLSSDCKTDSRRENYVKALSRHIQVDVYGTCGNKTCFPAQSGYCYAKILNAYHFYLSFENSICRDYVTEKFYNVLNYDVVPVVMGGAKYNSLAPEDSFIDALKYPDPKDLADFLKTLINNKNLYKKYFKWKKQYASYLYPWSCYLCDKIHGKTKRKAWYDLKQWWMNSAQCRRWVLGKGFVQL